jgi:hypothetical protein
MISGFVVSISGARFEMSFLFAGIVVVGFFWILFLVTVGTAVVVVREVVLVIVEMVGVVLETAEAVTVQTVLAIVETVEAVLETAEAVTVETVLAIETAEAVLETTEAVTVETVLAIVSRLIMSVIEVEVCCDLFLCCCCSCWF